MGSQARAAATRRAILAVAVELFDEFGYGGTTLNQIIHRAHVTQGGFYYHFASKEDVACAIVDEVAVETAAVRESFIGTPGAGLANVIEMTFELGVLLSRNRSYWVAAYLEHTVARHRADGAREAAARLAAFASGVARSVRSAELRDGLAAEDAARAMVDMLYGSLWVGRLLKDEGLGGDPATRLAAAWRMILPGIAAPDRLEQFEQFVESRRAGVTQRPGRKQSFDLFRP